MGTDPLISVLTPSFNQGAYIRDALNSVASQTYPRIEHIVMDGGSTDETIDVLRSFGDRVTWMSEQDRGQSHALNKAFGVANGEIIGWLNSDDAYFDPDVVSRAAECFEAHPDVDVVYGHAVRTTPDGRIAWILWTPRFRYRDMRFKNFLVQPAVFIRRSALADGLVDETYDFTMDWELWLRLGRNHRFRRLNAVLAVDRNHPSRKNITATQTFAEDEARLARVYSLREPPRWIARLYGRYYALRQRLMGGTLVHRVARSRFAFRGSVDSEIGLLLRQTVIPAARWTPENREAL